MQGQGVLFRDASEWPVISEHDVAIFGAGPGGIAAATAAARLGMNTIIVDKNGYPGGVATAGACCYLMGFGGDKRQIVGGVAVELVRLLDRMGFARMITYPSSTPDPRPIGDRPIDDNVIVSIEGMKVGANRLMRDAGVRMLYYTSLIGAVTSDDRIVAAAVDRAEGPGLIRAKTFVDATGDALLVQRAGGAVTEHPEDDAMTKTILLRVGGVRSFNRQRVSQEFDRLFREGRVPFAGQDRFMGFRTLNPDEVLLNFTLTSGSGIRSAELTRMDIELREQVVTAVDWYRREIPEFADCFLVDAAPVIGVRGGRCIVGLETITTEAVDKNKPVTEPVALGTRSYGGHSIKQFEPEWRKSNPGLRGIPMRALIPRSFTNVIAAGRAISSEVRAMDTFRLMSRCMAIGQAAGVIAGLCAKDKKQIHATSYSIVKEYLLKQGAILE